MKLILPVVVAALLRLWPIEASASDAIPSAVQKDTDPTPRAPTKDEASPLFQVSADPNDLVRLSIRNGIITVRGSVGSEEVAQSVIKRFAKIPDARQVRNRLTVRTNQDSAIAAQLREALSRDSTTRAGAIAVTVYRRRVFLSGAVSSEEERARAHELARGVPGVTRVIDGLRSSAAPRYVPQPVSNTRRITRTR